MSKKTIGSIVSAIVLFAGVAAGTSAQAQTPVRVANFPNSFVLPMYHALDKGYFKENGLDVDILSYQTGPAVVSAVVSGGADIAWSASIPPIQARANGVPVQLFLTAAQERVPDHATLWLVGTGKAQVKSVADLKEKTIMINANGGGCELALREHLAGAGLKWEDIKRIVVPFPEMQAALELGKADVGCAIEPFYHAILANKAIAAYTVASGIFTKTPEPTLSNGFFAREDWLKAHQGTAIKFEQAYTRARKELEANRDLQIKLATKVLGITESLARDVDLIGWRQDSYVTTGAVAPIIEAMRQHGQIKTAVSAASVVNTLDHKQK